ncbi:MAG: hypothetical protein V3U95_01190 [Dehalococcoidia bacterium]
MNNPDQTPRDAMEVIAEGTALTMRTLLKDGRKGHVGLMNPWTGRYSLTEQYQSMDVGYLLGRLWLLHLYTQRSEFRDWAMTLLEPLVPALTDGELTGRTAGVDIYYGLCWGADITGSEDLRNSAIKATDNLIAGLWQPQAGDGLFYSGASRNHTNIDSLLALLPLPWCAKYDSKYMAYFTRHADTIMGIGLVRPDGSTFQAALFDENHRLKYLSTTQGWKTDSTWARGQGWAMHNFVSAYEATGRSDHLDVAVSVCDWWVEHVPQDYVPHYDFDDPERFSKPKDSCAAALAVLALVRLARARPELAPRYQPIITSTIQELFNNYLTVGGLLLHGTWGNAVGRWGRSLRWPQEDVMPYGNYYFVEALYRSLTDDWDLFRLGPHS